MIRKVCLLVASMFFLSLFAYADEVVKLKTVETPDTTQKKEVEQGQPERKIEFRTGKEEQKVKKHYPIVKPSMLFTAPTARVINSMAIQTAGGGTISPEYEEQKRKFFIGIIGVGLGGISELQINMLGIFDNLAEGSANVPGTSLKIRLFRETPSFPEMSIMLRTSPGWVTTSSAQLNGNDLAHSYDFFSRSATLYLLASKAINPGLTLHFGFEASDYRLKVSGGAEAQETFYGGMIGFERNINDNTLLMGELRRVPELNFSLDKLGEVKPITLGVFGVRFFFIKIFAVDAGITYASDSKGLADAILHTNITTAFSLEELYETLFKQ